MKQHYTFLDGLRGIAAAAVGVRHGVEFFRIHFPQHAYLAVDFFFCLSGFVIAYAYGEKLRSGSLGFGAFSTSRLIRLYPMLLVGVLLGVAATGIAVARGSTVIPTALDLAILSLAALAFLPGAAVGYPGATINGPLWSLFFEMLASLVYAKCAKYLRGGTLREVLPLIAFALLLGLASARHGGLDFVGIADLRNFIDGIARVGFPFYAGVLIYRWKLHSRFSINCIIPIVILLAILFWPFFRFNWLYDWICAVVAVPAIIVISANARVVGPIKLWELLGSVSYPFYAIHAPILFVLGGVAWKLREVVPLEFSLFASLAVSAVFAYILLRFFDEPVRQSLRNMMYRRSANSQTGR